MKKGAQITIFIVLGIVLLLTFGLLLHTSNHLKTRQLEPEISEITSFDIGPIKAYVSSCLDTSLKEGVLYTVLIENDLNNYILTPRYETELSNLSIINCIIFGEDNIRFEDINKLMTLVRFKSIHYSIILDNINISHYEGHRIKINSDDKELNEMQFCKYQDILECCKWLIQIMNNINPELINHHNYHTLVEYCEKYDNYYEQRFNNLINYEKYRIEKINFE